ncbi:PepSY domain-containing protein [Sphingomonas sp.]|uniref:PepSY-associated TM helix domain-containing protein n=1 Tax=Sphingomonas sp. TaxID=28214 RepID=UPI0025D9A078|nr:PepSY domain-containing protein [Sphingomonas sp.]
MLNRTLVRSGVHRVFWRWHFYAGLMIAPFLLILSVTGAIYLFNDEINDVIYPEQRFVASHRVDQQPSRMIEAAARAFPGTPTRIDLPRTTGRSATVFITPVVGDPVRVAVDPATSRVLGSTVYSHTLVGFADEMHGSLTLGTFGDRIVELAACWALVLIVTGLFLWWPGERRGLAGVLYPRLRGGRCVFWRDLHVVTGVWAAAFIAFLLLTGLPWAGVEGALLNRGTAALGIGYPASNRTENAPTSLPMKTALGEAPWTMQLAPMPASAMPTGHAGHAMPMPSANDDAAVTGVDRIRDTLAFKYDLKGDYRLFLPSGPSGVYTAYTYPDQPQGQRTFYFDRWTGAMIREVGYRDYGWAAKAIELGIQLHMGNYFGLANQLLMLATCIAIIVLVVSGIVMWWRRRPPGTIGAPTRVSAGNVRGLAVVLVIGGVLFPVFGLSLVAIFLIDWCRQSLKS